MLYIFTRERERKKKKEIDLKELALANVAAVKAEVCRVGRGREDCREEWILQPGSERCFEAEFLPNKCPWQVGNSVCVIIQQDDSVGLVSSRLNS